ncbi:hypothetical protein [Aliidiomarina maris]|uniref:Uncharacterized protein n=1 Tax=Aliidiomarina maris TaxID=531312 RepID=A0A327XBI5_9GAMM|nr:hypothetical protein [Aliidiomarina maris]RAK01606.1 hypothetical protein B0I24_101229 [Aliidiomarina maris]RUO28432.1 hypothetical protein CWE07_01095 [Aliidiomarina maris]
MNNKMLQTMRTINQNPPREHVVMLAGGLNLSSATQQIPDGECLQLDNYEINVQGNYQSLSGFERYDGRLSPSKAIAPHGPYPDDESELQDLLDARENLREQIQPVPGAGPIRGVFYLFNRCFAFRDSEDGEQLNLYGDSPVGWQLVQTPTLRPGGYLRWRFLNFPDRASKEVIGVDGVNHGFIFDGQTFTQIINEGMEEDDSPIAVEVLTSDIVVFGYRRGSIQFSGMGDPFQWDVGDGAGEIRVVDEIQEIALQANDTCAVFCHNRTYVLYGRTPPEFRMTNLNTNTGATAGTVQTIGDSVFVDDRGMTRLSRVKAFGNFAMVNMSAKVDPVLNTYRNRIKCSTVIREKNQYRLFFDDGRGLICTFAGEEPLGFSNFSLGEGRVAACSSSAETSEGKEVVFIGAENGFVYQLERGTSLDGLPIDTTIRTAFSFFGPQLYGLRKRLTRFTLEIKAVEQFGMWVQPDFDYSSPFAPSNPLVQQVVIGGTGGYWDEAIYDQSYWSSAVVQRASFYANGVGENVSIFCRTESSHASPHSITSIVHRFIPLALRR